MTTWTDDEIGGTVWSDDEPTPETEIGSDQVTFAPSGTNPTSRTVQDKLRDSVCVWDFLSAAELADVQAETRLVDVTASFQRACNAAIGRTLYVPEGKYSIQTAGGVVLTGRVKIVGDGLQSTYIYRDFSPSADNIGAINFGVFNGSTLEDLVMISKTGTTGGTLWSVVSTAGTAAGFMHLRNVEFTFEAANTYKYPFYIDGSAKTAAPIGARDITFADVLAFGGTDGGGYIKGAVSFNWHGGGTFTGGSTSAKVIVTGDATVGSATVNINVSALGAVDLDYLTSFSITAGAVGAVTNTANVADGVFTAGSASSYQRNWKDVVIADGSVGVQVAKKTLTTSVVSYLGGTIPSFSLPDTQTFTFTFETGCPFFVYLGGGSAAMLFATNASATVTILSDPSSLWENSATPTSGKMGVFKSAGSFVVSIINETNSAQTLSVMAMTKITATTDPA